MVLLCRCADALDVDYDALQQCVKTSGQPRLHSFSFTLTLCLIAGNQLVHRMAEQTHALSPAPDSFPWVTVNEQPLRNVDDVIKAVCKTYEGRHFFSISFRFVFVFEF